MSETVDTRIVEMRFDNKNFESNVKQSTSTLDKLKQKLKLKGASKGLLEVEKTSRKVNFKETDGSLEKLGKKFSILEQMAIGAFRRIGERAADAGIKMAKSLSVDQVSSGWNKYAEKTTAVQTIMANIKDDASKFVDEASKMEYVNEQLEKLLWFSDETSYSFVDMTGNVGKFIANGQNLEDSVTAMQGIATWAAVSGQNAQTASRAMYNISQAMGVGSMKVKDWMSIENANMATSQFKELAITIGQKQGKIKEGQVTVESFRESLSGAGTNGWFDKDVMMEVFNVYGEAANKIRSFLETEKGAGMTATEVIRKIKEGNEDLIKDVGVTADSIGFKALAAAQEAKTFDEVIDATADAASTKWLQFFENIFGNYLEAKKMWTNLSEDLYDIFVEPLNGMNEVMSIWKRGRLIKEFESPRILEAYESGELDKLDNKLGSITKSAAEAAVKAAEADNSMFREIETLADGTQQLVTYTKNASGQYVMSVKKIIDADKHFLSGRTTLIEGFKNLLNVFLLDWEDDEGKEHLSVLGSLKKAFMEVFFPDLASAEDGGKKSIAEKLLELTEKFRDFTQRLKPLGDKLKNIFKGFFTIFKIVGKLIGAIIKPFKKLFGEIFRIDLDSDTGILSFLDNLSNKIQEFDKFLDSEGIFDSISEWIEKGIGKVRGAIDWVSKSLTGLSLDEVISKISDFFTNFNFKENFEKIGNFFSGMVSEIGQVETDNIPDKLTPLQNFWIGLKGFAEGLMGVLSFIFNKVIPFLANVFGKIGQFFGKIFGKLSGKSATKEADNAVSNVEEVGEKVNPVLSFLGKIFEGIKGFLEKAAPFFDALGEWIKTALGKFGEFLAGLAKDGKLGKNVTNFAKGGFFIALIVLIKTIKDVIKEFKGLGGAVKGMFNGVSGIFKNISGLFEDIRERFKKKNKLNSFKSIAMSILMIAGALFLVAQAFKVFANIEFKNTSVGVIAAIFAGFIAVSVLVALASKKIFTEKKDTKALSTMVVFMVAVTIALMSLASAFGMFSKIKFDNASVGVISLIFAGFIGITTLVAWAASKFLSTKKSEKSLLMMSAFMNAVASALVTLSFALLIAGRVKTDSVSLAVVGLIFTGFIGVTALVAWAATKFAKNKTAERALSLMARFMTSVAAALVILAAAFALISVVDFEKTPIGAISLIFAGFIVLTAGMAILGTILLKDKSNIAGVATIAGFMVVAAIALNVAALAIVKIAKNVDSSKLKDVVIIVGLLGVIAAVLAGVGLIAGAIGPWGILGLAVMAAVIISFGAACLIASKGIEILLKALAKDGKKAAKNLVLISAAIKRVIKDISDNFKNILLVAVAMIALSVAAGVLAPALTALILPVSLMILSIIGLMNAFSDFVEIVNREAPKFKTSFSDVINGILDVIIQTEDKATKAIGTIIRVLAQAITDNTSVVAEAIANFISALIIQFFKSLGEKLPEIIQSITDFINILATTIEEQGGPILDAVKNLLTSVGNLLDDTLNDWWNWKQSSFDDFWETIFGDLYTRKTNPLTGGVITSSNPLGINYNAEVVDDRNSAYDSGVEQGEAIADATAEGIEDGIESSSSSGNAVNDAVESWLSEYVPKDIEMPSIGISGAENGLGDMSGFLALLNMDPDQISSLGGMFEDLDLGGVMGGQMSDLKTSISDAWPDINAESQHVADGIEEPLTSLDSKKWGEDLVSNYAEGMAGKQILVETAATKVASTIDSILGFSEPERGPLSNFHTYAPDMIKLWCQGIKDNIGMVVDSSDSIAEKTDEGFSSALDYISKLIDGGMTDELTIRPVMDLSDIETGADRIKSMLSGNPYSLQTTGNIVSSAAYDMNRPIGGQVTSPSQLVTSNVTNHNTFNITNPDPDAVAKKVSVMLTNSVKRNAAVYNRS